MASERWWRGHLTIDGSRRKEREGGEEAGQGGLVGAVDVFRPVDEVGGGGGRGGIGRSRQNAQWEWWRWNARGEGNKRMRVRVNASA